MGQHLNDVKKLPKEQSRSLLKATSHKGKKEVKPTSDELCKMMKVKIDWQESGISCM
jgi:hypothetical protein